ncbi:MAG: polyprenol monophosphomannose synthase [Candidatus Marinimicrobia bacterium]|nr:polyprenol monophosphomannose synthase [Candidatus Neomarinimicrobiota bacterium]OQC47849.1 MAG: Undecaprenyl-phosphate mannosyltransferase [Candidatus Marinimicrobia bacterium ADurb.Bin030]NLA21793.1 polyprenol monophosphomannose synthase [Candidatus Neomarinimicrobiota bacterium]HOD37940.1 polyprenol monophosphomannose synthase [Candidatus Neomarinimicrobiota bacterium]HOG76207.1 polyprenol monophosphomannose synthase [Candidatus Neomarinimicrobiota bacterium]
MKSLVIIPTYNEKDNIRTVIERLQALPIELDILIIDDNSPDGTADIVRELQADDPHIFMINRPAKLGLGTAYITGFRWALERDYEYILEMDADLSHNPDDVPRLIQECENGYDLVIGSRYCNGVNVINWPIKRLLLSYGANKYTRMITRMPIMDATAGFKCYRREALAAINLDRVKSSGYSFQIEMHFRVWDAGFKIKEIPIIFIERSEGLSKMSKNIVWEAVFMVWKLKLRQIFRSL